RQAPAPGHTAAQMPLHQDTGRPGGRVSVPLLQIPSVVVCSGPSPVGAQAYPIFNIICSVLSILRLSFFLFFLPLLLVFADRFLKMDTWAELGKFHCRYIDDFHCLFVSEIATFRRWPMTYIERPEVGKPN